MASRELITWTDVDGNVLDLNDQVKLFCPRMGRKGDWMPPYTPSSTKMPLADGSTLTGIAVGERGIDWPLKLRADSRAELIALRQSLAFYLAPKRGQTPNLGQIKVTNEMGTRVLACYPDGIKDFTDHLSSLEATISFTANDPYWYDELPTTLIYSWTAPTRLFFPIPPLVVTASTLFSGLLVNNPGDTDVYPIWTITGPGDSIQLQNITTQETLSLNLTLAAGQQVIIDTRPGKKTVTVDGVNAFSDLLISSTLWALQCGDNTISAEINNANAITTQLKLQFTPRYLSE